MSAQIRQLVREPDPDVVVYLEKVLERAKAGGTWGVLVLEQDADGLGYTIVGVKDRFTVLGWLSHAMHRLQADIE